MAEYPLNIKSASNAMSINEESPGFLDRLFSRTESGQLDLTLACHKICGVIEFDRSANTLVANSFPKDFLGSSRIGEHHDTLFQKTARFKDHVSSGIENIIDLMKQIAVQTANANRAANAVRTMASRVTL